MSQEKKQNEKHHHPGFEPRTTRQGDSNLAVHLLSFLHDKFSGYVSIRTNRRLEKNDQKTKKAPAAGRRREHGLGRYLKGREE